MSNETSLISSGSIGSSFDGGNEHQSSLRKQVEAEKHAKINELLNPYRTKRAELQAKRDELAVGLEEVDKELNELDNVISQVESSVGLHPSSTKRRKHKDHKRSAKPAVDGDWIIQKLRERHMSFNEIIKAAKEEGFKPASAKNALTKLQDANLVRVNDGSHYEVV
jgi:predicted nuclease with TOPRIM domain